MVGNSYADGIREAIAGQMDSAERLLSISAAGSPMFADTHNNLGVVLQANGKHNDAIQAFKRAITINPTYAMALSNLAGSYAALGLNDEAEQAYRQSLVIKPAQPITLSNFATFLYNSKKITEAEAAFRKALTVEPGMLAASLGLGNIFIFTKRHNEAVSLYENLVEKYPENAAARFGLGLTLQATHRSREAAKHLEAAYSIDPRSPGVVFFLGKLLEEIGDLDRAGVFFREAIEYNPTNFNFYVSLVNVAKLNVDDPIFKAMEAYAGNVDSLSIPQRIDLFFAFSKVLTASGRQDEGFDFLSRANALRRSTVRYNEKRTMGGLAAIKQTYRTPLLQKEHRSDASAAMPIFIVGMPRSGSTLVDQILSSHPGVGSAGESPALPNALKSFKERHPAWSFPRDAMNLKDSDLDEIRCDYLQEIIATSKHSTSKTAPYAICDKYLSNFRYIGLILSIFPKVKIIHTFRDPIETCLSCFGINFNDQPFTYDLGELGRYYRAYSIMMHHWRSVLPANSILDVRYEAVVQETEVSARAILAYCGLEWDDHCLRFHETDRTVRTASVAQVRKPIYTTSVRKWRPHHARLLPLIEGLSGKSA